MEKACPSCYSCGMALEKPSDYALGNMNQSFCVYCTNELGELKPYNEILNATVEHLVRSQGIKKSAAMLMTREILSNQPAWKNKNL